MYKYDPLNKVNFHKYIDNYKHIVLIAKTIYGKTIAGYSEACFNSKATTVGNAFVMALWNKKIYHVNHGGKARGIIYDDFFLIFGNSEIRIKSQ